MSNLITCKGIVIREQIYGENDKFLVILTDTLGSLPVFCKGARSYKSKYMVCAQLFCYSELVLYKKGDAYWLREGSLIENFYGLREDIAAFALAQYLLEAVCEVTRENQQDGEIQRLLLNTLYALEKTDKPAEQIKAVFELRLCALSGFMPDLVGCAVCGQYEDGQMAFDISAGALYCGAHANRIAYQTLSAQSPPARPALVFVEPTVLKALRWAVFAPQPRLFAFEIPAQALVAFAQITERYLTYHVDKNFETLSFYKSVIT